MKGIVLAGGSGTRLYPATRVISKQLLPVYDKPLIYYPLSVLLLAGIRDILVISTAQDIKRFEALLSNGSQWGVSISYAVQQKPRGLADAFLIGKAFIGNDPVAMVLGDNIFYGNHFSRLLRDVARKQKGATLFSYRVAHPERYGVVTFDDAGNPTAITEKPNTPLSHYAVTGLYFYDNDVVDMAAALQPSQRGELEITDLNNCYLAAGTLEVVKLSRGMAWFDTGTFKSLLAASQFMETIEARQGIKIACLEEIAYRMGYIDTDHLVAAAEAMSHNDYGRYLQRILDD